MYQKDISRADMGADWPLTVEAGVLKYNPALKVGGEAVGPMTFIDPHGREWAVNGLAKDAGYPAIDPIWANEGSVGKVKNARMRSLAKLAGVQMKKKSISPLIEMGLALAGMKPLRP